MCGTDLAYGAVSARGCLPFSSAICRFRYQVASSLRTCYAVPGTGVGRHFAPHLRCGVRA
eukprot:1938798-Rhodomonas_salina.1